MDQSLVAGDNHGTRQRVQRVGVDRDASELLQKYSHLIHTDGQRSVAQRKQRFLALQ